MSLRTLLWYCKVCNDKYSLFIHHLVNHKIKPKFISVNECGVVFLVRIYERFHTDKKCSFGLFINYILKKWYTITCNNLILKHSKASVNEAGVFINQIEQQLWKQSSGYYKVSVLPSQNIFMATLASQR